MKLYVYEGRRRGQWYWRLRARNGRIVAVGGEAFSSARKALASYERVTAAIGRGAAPSYVRVYPRRKRGGR